MKADIDIAVTYPHPPDRVWCRHPATSWSGPRHRPE